MRWEDISISRERGDLRGDLREQVITKFNIDGGTCPRVPPFHSDSIMTVRATQKRVTHRFCFS